ncbi:hypothetical protein [Lentzea sp. NPDC051838]|uniref:hypothetical protein n=1 Tax=Lentzea sp. NPDC051838 TaxID=3154849 RepID=UPI0034329A27
MQYTWHLRVHLDGRRTTVWRQWIVPVVLTALSVVGLTALLGHFRQESRPDAVGDCRSVRSHLKALSYEKIDCSAYNASYRIAVIVPSPGDRKPGTCPFGPYRAVAGPEQTECLVLNAKTGDCLELQGPRRRELSERAVLVRAECNGAPTVAKVSAVLTGSAGGCEPRDEAIYYAQPETTICLRRP